MSVVVLSHQTALREYMENPRLGVLSRQMLVMQERPKERDVAQVLQGLGRETSNAHELVSHARFRNHSYRGISYHVLPAEYPAKTVIDLGACLIVSPEVCFLQMAETLDFASLVLLAYALCGRYNHATRTQRAWSASSVAALRAFAQSCPRAPGRLRALRALEHVCDNSRSPVESRLAFILCAPTKLGGYGFAKPQLNVKIDGTSRLGDICWPNQRIDVEYDSHEHHSSSDAQERDSERRTEVLAAGYRVITIARSQVMNPVLLDKVARCLLVELGCDSRRRWELHRAKNRALHSRLFREPLPESIRGFQI